MLPGNIYEEQRVFNIEATAIDSTQCSKYIIAAGYYRAFIINTSAADVPTEVKIKNKLVTFLSCHPKHTQNVAIVSGNDIGLYSLDTMKQQVRWKNANGSSRYVSDLSWSHFENNMIAACSPYDSTLIRDIRNCRKVAIEVGAQSGATQVKFSPMLDHILATSSCNQSILWDIRYPKRAISMVDCHSSSITCLKWHPTQKHSFFTCSKDSLFRCWDFFNENGDFTENVDFLERDLDAWRFWFSSDGAEYAIVKSPLLQKFEGGMEVYQYPFQENLNPLKIDNSDLFVDLCWSKNLNKPNKYLWALRQSKGLIRHSIIFDYSGENREGMATPIAQSAMDEESDRLINQKCEQDSESSSEYGSPDVDKGGIMIGEMDLDSRREQETTTNCGGGSNKYSVSPISTLDVGLSAKFSPDPSALVAHQMLSRHSGNSLQGHIPASPIISDYERWITAPGTTGDLNNEMDALWNIGSKGVTMTEINIPRAALGYTYEHRQSVKKLAFEMRFHKNFFDNGKILVKILEKDCPFNPEQARTLLLKMQKEADAQIKLNKTTPVFARVVAETRKLVVSMGVYHYEDSDSDERKPSVCSLINEDNMSEESERHSVSLSFIPSQLDDYVPAPRTSGAQFDSSGFLVRFGNFRSTQRAIQRSDSKLSGSGLDYRQLGIIEVENESEGSKPMTAAGNSSDEEKSGGFLSMFKTRDDFEESDDYEMTQRMRVNRKRRLRMRGLISNSESKLSAEDMEYLAKLETLSDDSESSNSVKAKSKSSSKKSSEISSSSSSSSSDDDDTNTTESENVKKKKTKTEKTFFVDPFLPPYIEPALTFPRFAVSRREKFFRLFGHYPVEDFSDKEASDHGSVEGVARDESESSSCSSVKFKDDSPDEVDDVDFEMELSATQKLILENPQDATTTTDDEINETPHAYEDDDDDDEEEDEGVNNLDNIVQADVDVDTDMEADCSDSNESEITLEEDFCRLETFTDEHPPRKKDESFSSSGITSIVSLTEYCQQNRALWGFKSDEEYHCPNKKKYKDSKKEQILQFDPDDYDSTSESSQEQDYSSDSESDMEYYRNSKKPASSVLMHAPKASLFPFGDKPTTPKSFCDYLMMMEPILKEFAELKRLAGHCDEHGLIGSSFSPELLPKGDAIPFPCVSPVRNYSLSSSPTTASILLHRNNPSGRFTSPPNSSRSHSSRHRGGSLTLIDSDSNIKGSSSDALVSTPVELFDISYYLPVSKRMAKNYRFIGGTYDQKVKRHRKLAEKENRTDVSKTWEICEEYMKSCFKKTLFKHPRRCKEEVCPTNLWDVNDKYDSKADRERREIFHDLVMNTNRFQVPWSAGPISEKFFANILENHIESGDVQAIAAITCTLGEPCKLPPISRERRTSLTSLDSSTLSPRGKTQLMRSISEMEKESSGPLTVMWPPSAGKNTRSASIGTSPGPLAERNTVHGSLMTVDPNEKKPASKKNENNFDFLRRMAMKKEHRSNSVDIGDFGPFLSDMDSLVPQKTVEVEVTVPEETELPKFSSLMQDTLFFSYSDDEECPTFEIDPRRGTPHESYLGGKASDQFEMYRIQYAEILARWGYFKKSAEVLKFCPSQQPQPFSDIVVCQECQEVLEHDGTDICNKCGIASLTCSICDLSCFGLFISCPLCAHGGHVDHMKEWFKEQTICPFGCGCPCPF